MPRAPAVCSTPFRSTWTPARSWACPDRRGPARRRWPWRSSVCCPMTRRCPARSASAAATSRTLPAREREALRGAEMGIVFQESALALNPVLTVGSQIGDVVRAHTRCDRSQVRERTFAAMHEVGLTEDTQRIYDAYPARAERRSTSAHSDRPGDRLPPVVRRRRRTHGVARRARARRHLQLIRVSTNSTARRFSSSATAPTSSRHSPTGRSSWIADASWT